MTISLPTAKTPPTLTATTAKVLLYGPPKIGKTTLAHGLDPDHTLFLCAEPGQGAIEAYKQAIASWGDFRATYGLLQSSKHHYKTVVIDTVDMLHEMCSAEVMRELNISHPSDLEWGKGWKAVSDKFRLAIGGLSSMGLGIWFISHAKDVEIKQRVGTITRAQPSVAGASRDFLTGFVDHIFYLTSADTGEGEQRVLKTDASEYWEAGSRLPAVQGLGQLVLPKEDPAGPVRDLLGV